MNRVIGARLVWRETSSESGGRALVFELQLEPNGFAAPLHRHPRQQQRIEVLAGNAGTQVGRRLAVVGPGTRLTIPAGTPHRLWNAGDGPLHLVVEVTPALRFESLLERLFALGAAAEARDPRRPGRLRLAALAVAHLDTVRLAFPYPPVRSTRRAAPDAARPTKGEGR